MKFGTLQNVIEEPLTSVFAVAADLGFDGVELDWNDLATARPGGPLGPENRRALRQAAEEAGVEIPSVAAHFLKQGGLADPSSEKQAFGLEAVRAGIALCADLGAGYLLVPFFGPATLANGAAVTRLVENLKRLAPEAAAAAITLAIEHTLPGIRRLRFWTGSAPLTSANTGTWRTAWGWATSPWKRSTDWGGGSSAFMPRSTTRAALRAARRPRPTLPA